MKRVLEILTIMFWDVFNSKRLRTFLAIGVLLGIWVATFAVPCLIAMYTIPTPIWLPATAAGYAFIWAMHAWVCSAINRKRRSLYRKRPITELVNYVAGYDMI